MGSSESKIVVATPRPERGGQIRNERLCRLVDPRSPSTGIDRTPIQVGEFATRGAAEVESEDLVHTSDPRSPTLGISRTPMKDVMRATVNSFARRLGLVFLSEGGDTHAPVPPLTFSKLQSLNLEEEGEADSAEALLPLHSPHSATVDPDVCPADDPVCAPPPACDSLGLSTQDLGFSAEEEQGQVDVEAKQFVDEATVDGDSTLSKELSLSLLTCHDGVVSSQMLSDDISRPVSPLPNIDPNKEIDSEACLSPTPDPDQPLIAEASTTPSLVSSDMVELPNTPNESPIQPEPSIEESATADSSPSHNLNLQTQSEQVRVKHPTFNTKSPSQVVFKPQWLGVGFGVTGVRARGVQGRGKGGSSPLSVRGGGKAAGNENKGQVAKQKQRERCGKTLANEVRSPLQILKETNSPRDHASQLKLKIATPERQRLGQIDRRALSLSLDKENQR